MLIPGARFWARYQVDTVSFYNKHKARQKPKASPKGMGSNSMKNEAIKIMQTLSDFLTTVGAHIEHGKIDNDLDEFYEISMFCYDLLARTKIISSILVKNTMKDDDNEPDFINKYGIACGLSIDLIFEKVKKGSVALSQLQKAKIATDYYENYRSKTLVSGFEKVVVTDGYNTMFVNSDYEPKGEEVVFKLDTRRGQTGCQLYKPRINQ